MTRAEQRKMRRLELENERLRQQLDKQFDIYRAQAYELVELQIKYQLIKEIIEGRE